MPPDAEPVSAESTLVAIARDTSGPPPIDSTRSRTTAKAGIAATTAPKPTRLATPMAGSTEALAPASMLSRKDGSREQLSATTVRIADESAVATDHQQPTEASELGPQRSSAR